MIKNTMTTNDLEFKICLKVSDIPIETLQNILTQKFYDGETDITTLKEILQTSQLDILDLYWDI